ncbi:MAG: peptidoglycan-binding protein [Ruminococcaceae bacterium]|nr:peptidoglycan-binding protein [Oscillospiraceae bacterium]
MPKQNNQAIAIRNLQTYLRQLAYHNDAITAPPVDGVLNSATQQSIRDFQISRQLEPTGITDRLLWELIYASYRASLAENTPPQRMEVFPLTPLDASFSIGAAGFPVAAIQFMLREAEANYGFLRPVEVTGTYTENTADAVRAFQQQNGLRPSGIVDRATWNELTDQHNILFTGRAVE